MSRNRAVAIVIHHNKLLVMHRKNDKEYYTFPGGGIEAGETNEQATIREIKEEASLDIEVEKLVYELHHDNGDIHYYFLCRYLKGEIAVQPGTNEYADNELGRDIHQPLWLPLQDVSKSILYPFEVRDRLIIDKMQNFSNQVVRLDLPAMS
ncbi:MAG: NUDIX domain-containing protein [Candidatus Saccharimonas sp.]